MPLCFSRVLYLFFGIEIAKRKLHSLQPCKFLTDNNTRWAIDAVYRYFAGEENIIEAMGLIKITGEVPNLLELSLFKLNKYELTYLNKQVHNS